MSPKRRIFIKRGLRRIRVSFLLIAGFLVTVAACSPESVNWSPMPAPKRNEVRWITFEHTVRFGPGGQLSTTEEERLGRFLSLHDAGYGDQLLVGAVGSRSRDGDTRAAARREAAVSGALRDRELPTRLLPQAPTRETWDGSVKVVLGRFIVLPPDCPDWTKPAGTDPVNSASGNFGCATATNLGLMVANPEDLVRGRTPGPADGAAGARLYKNYREGEQAPPPSITPLVIQSGVGGASQ